MAVFENEHPFGQNMESVYSALYWGMTADKSTIPPHLRTNYVDLVSGSGVARLRVVNLKTEKRAFYTFPINVADDNYFWKVSRSGMPEQVQQRLVVDDMYARPFIRKLLDGSEVVVNYLQFDVLKDGIVLTHEVKGDLQVAFGGFVSTVYDDHERLARELSSIDDIMELAQPFSTGYTGIDDPRSEETGNN